MSNRRDLLWIVALLGFLVGAWRISVVIGDLSSWNAWDQPAEVSKLIQAALLGVVAVIAFLARIGFGGAKQLIAVLGSFVGAAVPAEPPNNAGAVSTDASIVNKAQNGGTT